MIDSRTQRVCKHCQNTIKNIAGTWYEASLMKKAIDAADAILAGACSVDGKLCRHEPVAEPASTGEQTKLRCVSELALSTGGKISCEKSPDHKHDHYGYLPDGKLVQWVQWPARPSEPSAPRKSAIEIAGERDLRVITEPIDWEAVENDAAPQTSAEPNGYIGSEEERVVLERKALGDFIAAPQPVSGDAPGDFTEAELVAIERSSFDGSQLWRLARQLRERTAEREAYDSQRKYLLKKLAVAGTQPHLRHRIADLLKIASSSEGGPSEDAVFDYVKALAGAAQGTLQVEEISREIAEKLAAMHLIVWQGLGQAIHEYAKEAAAILRKHLAGAPAQPGPDFKKVRNIWPVINRYRGLLIDRKLAGAITQDELTFLDSLQIFADWYLEAVVPRDASELEKLEAIVAAPALATPEPPKVEELPIADWRLEQIKQIRAYGLQAEPTALLLAIDDLLQALRPYFPPASQTPERGWMGSRGQFDAGDE